uniref:Domain X domain-containing protein n=1 Tax=Placozoa sp. H11 HM-2017 TaxID=2017598 RepID=A0A7I6N2M4_9METZ|nr:hypothetical protein [Placozoa sp. H11 HM-2017]
MRQPIVRMNGQLMISNCHNVRTFSELGSSERKFQNTASRKKAWMEQNVEVKGLQSVPSMVRAYLWSSLLFGISLGRNGACMLPMTIWILVFGVVQHKGGPKDPQTERRPKEGYKHTYGSLGLPKEIFLYGNRVKIVRKSVFFERLTAKCFFFHRYYSTGCRDLTKTQKNPGREKVIKKMRDLTKRVLKNPNQKVDRKLYDLVCNPYMLEFAYNNIKKKPKNITKGIVPKTLDGMSWSVFLELAKELKEEKFQFKSKKGSNKTPSLRSGSNPFSVAPREKIALEVMRMILNEVFEPTFLDCSHGFRPGRSLHSAAGSFGSRFKPSAWVIEGNKCFLKVDHSILMNIIEEKIKDRQFTKLIWKSLGAGCTEFGANAFESVYGAPQGTIIGPVLRNIYLHKLDKYILKLKVPLDIGKRARKRAPKGTSLGGRSSFLYNRYSIKNEKKEGRMGLEIKSYKELPRGAIGAPNFLNYKRISYVRFADDWIIGVRGSYQETVEILSKVLGFCKDVLKLEVNKEKPKITSLKKGKVGGFFQGLNVPRTRHGELSGKKVFLKRKPGLEAWEFSVSLDRIKRKLREIKILKGEKPTPRFFWVHLTPKQIISLFNSVLKGYLNYYSFVCNFSRFKFWLKWVITTSAGMTLARKYNTSTNKIFSKYGQTLKFSDYSIYQPKKKEKRRLVTKK